MHVAYLCADRGVPVFGTKGSSVHVQEIIRAWRNAGDDVTLYCTRRGEDRPADLADLDVVEIQPLRKADKHPEQALQDAALDLADTVLRDGCNVFYERYSLFSPALSLVAQALGVPSILEVNSPLIEEQQRYRQLLDVATAESILRKNAEAAQVVSCVSEPVVHWVRGYVPAAKTVLAPNGVNIERITPRRPGRQHSGHLRVAFVGTLKPWHGVPDLLHAVAIANTQAEDPDRWTVRIIGDGPERNNLEQLAAALGVETEFTGAVPPGDVPGLLHVCDAAMAPYPPEDAGREDYFSPLKIYEYMAAAMPIIATSVGQIPSILEHGRTGLLVPGADTAGLASALTRLAAEPVLRASLGRQARAEAEKRFSWNRVLSTITEVLT